MCDSEGIFESVDKRLNKIELQLEIEQEQRRLLWSYIAEVTEAYNKLSENLGANPLSLPHPNQKSLRKYD